MTGLSHIALLVRSADKAAARLKELGFSPNPPDVFEKGKVREIYIGDYAVNSSLLLLVEPVKKTAYARTFKKSGYGLHHIAVDVPDLEKYVDGLYDSGWLLHPWSLEAARTFNTVYLCRPGLGFVIEVQKRERGTAPRLIERIALPLSKTAGAMVAAAGLADAVSAAPEAELFFSNKRSIRVAELLG
jgi:catechol 2,3-dioxygenase-like lactoylglutathione lyase family enzyme